MILEKWERITDKGKCVSAKCVLWTYQDLMFAKPKPYSFSGEALKFMQNYLINRKQRVHINKKFSFERNVIAGVPQGFIDRSVLFNLFIYDEQSLLSNYADDNHFFVSGKDKEVSSFLRH